ncbi:MAG: aminotransferase class I/II-fold pyridoxal phosphate-dependent enzyme [Flavobacteriales bacterium]|nr:aminotransferase class I/II-fold pyridoxal phosphate-dependent enzyme [Flavobacteriales bacterium]MCZ2444405.1 aminotransferase class I/II-fold pyridoxal phosphate-dependent enzyme [Flavobacteriales bacterium]
MKGRFPWWPEWQKKKSAYAHAEEKQVDPDRFNTICAGTGLPGIHQKSTFKFKDVADGATRFLGHSLSGEKPYARIYTRLGNPNTEYLEKVLFQLECDHIIDNALKADEAQPTIASLVFASGMAAISTIIMGFVQPGDCIIVGNVYGCTDSFMRYLQNRFGVKIVFVDATKVDDIARAIQENPNAVAVFVESPDNPTLQLCDLEAISALTTPEEIMLIVDNTFCSPYLQQPFRLGVDVVVHSLTKYVNGHSTSIAGAALGPFEFFSQYVFPVYKDFGPTPSPFDSWLNSLTIQEMGVRMKHQCETAQVLAEFLESHPKVKRVWYPGLKSHPHHQLAQRQMRNGGAVISFELKGGFDAGVSLMNFFARPDTPMELAVSLGSVISYIEHPASMTHAVVPEADRLQRGITDSLVRLSVGVEGFKTLSAALEKGLQLS